MGKGQQTVLAISSCGHGEQKELHGAPESHSSPNLFFLEQNSPLATLAGLGMLRKPPSPGPEAGCEEFSSWPRTYLLKRACKAPRSPPTPSPSVSVRQLSTAAKAKPKSLFTEWLSSWTQSITSPCSCQDTRSQLTVATLERQGSQSELGGIGHQAAIATGALQGL